MSIAVMYISTMSIVNINITRCGIICHTAYIIIIIYVTQLNYSYSNYFNLLIINEIRSPNVPVYLSIYTRNLQK